MRRFLRRLIGVALLSLFVLAGWSLLHPQQSLIPAAWNPTKPLEVADPITPLTDWKIRSVMAHPGSCTAILEGYGAALTPKVDLVESDACFIAQRVSLTGLQSTRLRPFDTTCEVALRLAMWREHSLAPAAEQHFGQGVREIRHYSSYNCRRIRTSRGESDRMSTHATARAVDVSGFVLDDGTLVDLKKHWNGEDAKAAFLRDAQQGACDHFGLVLGPNYNALHADHFHMQLAWDGCR